MTEEKIYVLDWDALHLSFELSRLLQELCANYSERGKHVPKYLHEMLRIVDNALSEAHEALASNQWVIEFFREYGVVKLPGDNDDKEKEEEYEWFSFL
jgi:hypothetical protein